MNTLNRPLSVGSVSRQSIVKAAIGIAPLSAMIINPFDAMAGQYIGHSDALSKVSLPLSTISGSSASLSNYQYSSLGDMDVCKIINGMWQVSGAHGYSPKAYDTVGEMARYADLGFTSFDLADIYGPAETFVGEFMKSSAAKDCLFFTKWVPRPQEITKNIVQSAIERSLKRMNTGRLDLLQFHWWDYSDKNYYAAIHELMDLKEKEYIRNLGLTNFDTAHMVDLIDQGAPLVSNQVSFSVLDTRPLKLMVPAAKEHNVKLLCYGTLLGGFLSSQWLGKSEPDGDNLTNVSLRKYLPWIQAWGGWKLFQELLSTLDDIGKKHQVPLATVAERWVLDQEQVAGCLVGVRFGLGGHDHSAESQLVFATTLDDEDRAKIAAVQAKGRDLMRVFGDCGGEYRRRA